MRPAGRPRRRCPILAVTTFISATSASSEGFPPTPVRKRPYVQLDMYAPVASRHPRFMTYDLGNENWHDVGGLLKHLLIDVLPESGQTPGRSARAGDIDHIMVLHLRVFNNPDATSAENHWEFAPYIRFKDGAVAPGFDAEEALARLQKYGDQVGVKAFRPGVDPHGELAEPRFAWDGIYYSFSISGPCPNLPDGDKDIGHGDLVGPINEDCLRHKGEGSFLGGSDCRFNVEANSDTQDKLPLGVPGCVMMVEGLDFIPLDKLVGIRQQDCGLRPCTSWHDFHVNCTESALQFQHGGQTFCREFDSTPECARSCEAESCQAHGDVGLPFWRNRCDASWNAERGEAIVAASLGHALSPVLRHAASPSCSKHPGCSDVRVEEGLGYCHRDTSGICDACFVPGTVSSRTPATSQPRCRADLFHGVLAEYQQQLPKCSSPCGGRCSMADDAAACCVYIGACTTDWEVGSWGACSSSCGEGVRKRKVACPYSDAAGFCDMERRPRDHEACRGNRCPWHEDSGDNWGLCDDSCGPGMQQKRLRCDCPAPCPGGNDECAASRKPRPHSRRCQRMSGLIRGNDYCKKCSPSCSRCLDGFRFSNGIDGHCVNMRSFAKASFYVGTAGRLFEQSDVSLALSPAFERAMKEVAGVYVQVVSLTSIEDRHIFTARTLVTIAATRGGLPEIVNAAEESKNVESPQEVAAFLSQTQQRLNSLDKKRLAKALARELREELNGALQDFPVWIDFASKPEGFCSQLRRWRGSEHGCSEASAPPAKAPVEVSSVAPVVASLAMPTEAAEPSGDGGVDESHGSGYQGGNDTPDSHGPRPTSPSVGTGAALGAAMAAVLVLACPCCCRRCRQGSGAKAADKTHLFKGLSGTSSW